MSLSGIRTKIDTALGTITGLNHAGKVPSVVIPPMGFPQLRETEPVSYDFTAVNASLVYHFYINVVVNKGGVIEQGQDDLDPYLHSAGSTSVKAAIEAIDWASTAGACRVMSVSNYGPIMFGGVEYLGARLGLDIWVSS